MGLKIIITGTTGMVGEGVMLHCLEDARVEMVLAVSRKSANRSHPKLTELLVPDFMNLAAVEAQLTGYDACFYGAGISSVGLDEATYTKISYDTPVHFATVLIKLPFKATYNFRPALMKPVAGQRSVKTAFKPVLWLYPLWKALFPGSAMTLNEIGDAMIRCVLHGAPKPVLEVADLQQLVR